MSNPQLNALHPQLIAMLQRASKRVQPATIIDVGASNGQWSDMALSIWPQAAALLIEANPVWKPESDIFCKKSGALATWAVAGANEGHAKVEFFKEEPCQGIKLEPTGAVHPVTTVDAEIARTKLPSPYPIMQRYGFRPTDICAPTEYRPCDGRCAAIDMLFERSDAPDMDKFW